MTTLYVRNGAEFREATREEILSHSTGTESPQSFHLRHLLVGTHGDLRIGGALVRARRLFCRRSRERSSLPEAAHHRGRPRTSPGASPSVPQACAAGVPVLTTLNPL